MIQMFSLRSNFKVLPYNVHIFPVIIVISCNSVLTIGAVTEKNDFGSFQKLMQCPRL